MRHRAIPVAVIAVATLSGCDKGKLTEPEQGKSAETVAAHADMLSIAAGGRAARITEKEAGELINSLLPMSDTPLSLTLRKQLANRELDAVTIGDALRSVEASPDWERNPELVALHITLQAALRSMTGADETNAKSTIQ